MNDFAQTCFWLLLRSICSEGYRGYDPYDGLNSRLLRFFCLDRFRPLSRIAQQVIKRLPINIRQFLLVPKGLNPKGIALCLSALSRFPQEPVAQKEAKLLVDILCKLRSPDFELPCWGYNFRWESRLFSLPAHSPNAICTVFAGEALLDAWLQFGFDECRESALGAARFLRSHLNVTELSGGACFSYTTIDSSITHNVNLLVTAYLWRAAKVLDCPELSENLDSHLQLTLSHQWDNGAWPYGEDHGNEWVDGIHQGFNLIALDKISRYHCSPPTDLEDSLHRGLVYYCDNMFTDYGMPKYFDNSLYPLDIHTFAVAIVTLTRLSRFDPNAKVLMRRVLDYALRLFWNDNKKYFAYQIWRGWGTVDIPFMRWGQAWMLFALAEYLSMPQR